MWEGGGGGRWEVPSLSVPSVLSVSLFVQIIACEVGWGSVLFGLSPSASVSLCVSVCVSLYL